MAFILPALTSPAAGFGSVLPRSLGRFPVFGPCPKDKNKCRRTWNYTVIQKTVSWNSLFDKRKRFVAREIRHAAHSFVISAALKQTCIKQRSIPWTVFKFSDIEVDKHRCLGSGAYGEVFVGFIVHGQYQGRQVIFKKNKSSKNATATNFARVELQINQQLSQGHCPYVAAFLGHCVVDSEVWLVWDYEGSRTLEYVLRHDDWIDVLEQRLLGEVHYWEDRPYRHARMIKEVMGQILGALEFVHSQYVVHRDIKPLNLVVGEDGHLKLIDFGAAIDWKTRFGYDEHQGAGDKRFLPPEQFVCMDRPDRFDTYSAGVIMLEMAFPNLRNGEEFLDAQKGLRRAGYSVDKWLQGRLRDGEMEDLVEGLSILNADEGAGWDLLRRMLTKDPRDRISASAALHEHRYLRTWRPFCRLPAPAILTTREPDSADEEEEAADEQSAVVVAEEEVASSAGVRTSATSAS